MPLIDATLPPMPPFPPLNYDDSYRCHRRHRHRRCHYRRCHRCHTGAYAAYSIWRKAEGGASQGQGEANAFGGREGLGHRLAAAWVCVCEGGVRRPGSYVLRETIRVRPAAFSGVRFFTLSYLPLPCSRTHFLARKGFTLTTFSGAREGVLVVTFIRSKATGLLRSRR